MKLELATIPHIHQPPPRDCLQEERKREIATMESLPETISSVPQEETKIDDVRRGSEQVEEEMADASPSAVAEEKESPSASENPQPISYTLLDLNEQHAWDDIMGRLLSWELIFVEDVLPPVRQVHALPDQIETYPRLTKVHSEHTPCLLQRLCLGKRSILRRLSEDEHHEDDALEIVKRLIDLNPEALLWTKVLDPEENEPIVKDLVKNFPKIGLFIFEQHRRIFDSEDPVANIVTCMVCSFGGAETICELLFSYPQSRLLPYQSHYPIQVVNERLCKRTRAAVSAFMNREDPSMGAEEYAMALLLSRLLKPENGDIPVELLQPMEQDSAAVSLMWSSLLCPLGGAEWFSEEMLGVATTILLKQRVSTPTFNFNQVAGFMQLDIFISLACTKVRRSPSMFKFLKTMLRIVRVNDFHLEQHVQGLDVVSHLLPLVDKELEIEQEYVKLRHARTMISKFCEGSEEKKAGDEDESEDNPLEGFVQGLLDAWAKERLEGCSPRIRAIRAEMNKLPPETNAGE